jgi:hypothetical protein
MCGAMATAEASTGDGVPPPDAVSSFAKSLFLGEIHGDMVFPYPCPGDDEERRIRDIVRALEDFDEDITARSCIAGCTTSASPTR